MGKKLLLMLGLMSLSITSFAQKVNVSGQVFDDTNEPLIGVLITVKNTTTGTTTGLDGKFTISVDPKDQLEFSYLGFKPQTIVPGERRVLKVVLESMATEMDEVVVVGYGTQRRSDISTAVSSVNMKDIARSGSSQILQALQGKVSGVQILSTDGSLTGGLNFRIRGVNSITGGTQPLFVIDGVAQPPQNITNTDDDIATNPLLGINPNDIASMEILKDAAAAAIYGADGANGVVLITTKQGVASEKPKFSISYTRGLDMMAPNPLVVLTPKEYAYKSLEYSSFGNVNTMAFWQNVIDTKGWNDPSVHVWMDDVTQMGSKDEVNASMSGGTKATTYMLSLGYLNNTALIKNSSFRRFTSRLNLTQKVNTKITIGTNLSYTNYLDKNSVKDWSQTGIVLNALRRSPYLYYPGYSELKSIDNVGRQSPLVAVEQIDLQDLKNEVSGRLYFDYRIIKDLTFFTSFAIRKGFKKQSKFWGPDTWYGQSEGGRMELSNDEDGNWTYEARLQYSKKIQKHNFSVMGAFEVSKWSSNKIYNKATNYEDSSLGIWGIGEGLVTFAPKYTYDANQSLSYISRATYSYDNRYVFNASLRVDGSSRFGINNKYGYFPSLSFAWRASEEKFIKKVDFISNLRLRASFGMTGNKQIPSYQSLSRLYTGKVVMNQDGIEIGRYPAGLSNDDLRWESQKQYNVGLDFGVLKDRFSLVVDAYYKKIDDMLLEATIPATSGYNKAWKNAGSMENKGVDLSLTANWFTGKFQWSTNFNISFYRNKVLALADGQYQDFYTRGLNEKIDNDVLLRVGMPVGLYYGYISDGVYNTEAEVANGPQGANRELGGLKVLDLNHDNIIDDRDKTIVANVNPKHYGGIGNNFSYKGFDLYVFFTWSYGNDVVNGNAYYLSGARSNDNILKSIYKGQWSEANPDRNYPIYGSGEWGQTVFRSDLVEDGSFLRLQTLSLGYNIPAKLLKRIGLSSARIALTGSNLWLLTRYSGFDPEANTGYGTVSRLAPGFDRSSYPRPRSLSLSLELGF